RSRGPPPPALPRRALARPRRLRAVRDGRAGAAGRRRPRRPGRRAERPHGAQLEHARRLGAGARDRAGRPAEPRHGSQPARDDWRAGLAWAAARCSERNVLMAGDFNATLDHFAGLGTGSGTLRTCRDGALATRNAAVGTWPTSMPALIGTPIDHVLATPNWR